MTFQRPTLSELIDRTVQDIESRLVGVDAHLRRSVARALMTAHAGAVHGLHGHLAYLAQQIIPDTAEGTFLERHSAIKGITRKAAVAAAGSVDCTGSNGSVIPAGTKLQRSDGAEYTTDADATIAGGVATVAVTASEAGADGNAEAGTALSFVTPVAGVDSTATVASGGLTGGFDAESDEELLERYLLRVQEPPQGGADADYLAWALEVTGITRAWVRPLWMGGGTVGVTGVLDNQVGGILPDAAKVTELGEHVQSKAPVHVTVIAFAPVAVPLDLTIQLTPNTAAVQAAVEAEIEDLLLRKAEPGGTILLSHLNEVISLAEGETDHVLVSPAADVTHANNELAVPGVITWQ